MSSSTEFGALSRRSVLQRGAVAVAAGATAPVFSGLAGPLTPGASAAALPLVVPKSSQKALEAFGVCAMPHFDKTAYHYRSAWVSNLHDMGVSYIRAAYGVGSGPTYETVSLIRQRRMKWGMIAIAEDELSAPDSRIIARVNDIAARAADICLYVEGINEPNHNRNGSRPPSNWKELTLQKQKTLWQAVQARPELRGRVAVLSPSFQMNHITDSDYQWFAARGMMNYMTHSASHAYSGGRYPDAKFASLLGPMQRYWKKPVWVTETGFTNAVDGPQGPSPVPESVSGVYAPSAVLEAVDRNWKTVWFEVLDDPDAGSKSEIEANYGLFALQNNRMAPPWRAKPAAVALKGILTGMRDPGQSYQPRSIGLRVSAPVSDVRWTALGKRDGSVRLYLRRANTASAPKVNVTITTAKGSRSVSVGTAVTSVLL